MGFVNHHRLFAITYRRNKLESLGQILVELGHKFRHFKDLFRNDLHCHVDIVAIYVKVKCAKRLKRKNFASFPFNI